MQTQIRLRSSLIRVFPVCYSDKYFVNVNPEKCSKFENIYCTSPTELASSATIFSCGTATTLWQLISMIRCPTRTPPLSAIPPRNKLQIWKKYIYNLKYITWTHYWFYGMKDLDWCSLLILWDEGTGLVFIFDFMGWRNWIGVHYWFYGMKELDWCSLLILWDEGTGLVFIFDFMGWRNWIGVHFWFYGMKELDWCSLLILWDEGTGLVLIEHWSSSFIP